MHVKIFFNDKPLFLCDAIDDTVQPYIHHDDAVFIDELDLHTVKTMIHEMQQEKVHAGVFLHPDLEALKKAFEKKFTVIQAAGGLVKNKKDEVLMIFRRGSWDLPKGKLDPKEKLEDCALREVSEETGLKKVKLISPLTTTYHTYHQGSKFILKESHWFNMNAEDDQQLIPQTEEDITDIKWVAVSDVDGYLKKAYPLIRDIMAAAGLSSVSLQ